MRCEFGTADRAITIPVDLGKRRSAGQPAHRPTFAGPLRDSFAARRVEFLLADAAISVAVEIGEGGPLHSLPAGRARPRGRCRRLRWRERLTGAGRISGSGQPGSQADLPGALKVSL